MASHRNTNLLLRGALAFVCVPLLLSLAGCPSDTASTGAPGRFPANATAPQVSAAQQQDVTRQQQAASAQAAQQHARKVQQTIAVAEADYQSGVQNYNDNHLDAARLDFDAAVDGMLTSGLDLKNDPQMSDEFDNLVSKINALEMVALKQGNGFSPKVEAAPIDITANEETFPIDPNLVNRANAELKTTVSDFPLVMNDQVAFWVSYFTNSRAGHAHLVASLERAGKYKAMIEKILREQGVPQDLIYQAITESGFQPQVVNRSSGAGGMWQFMPFAGSYGLERNGYFDERFDPVKSTIAYAKYMKSLYNQFGDWYLAMAAYDWGPGRVQHVVSRTGYADYWQLSEHGNLPAETKNYIPGVIASIIMAKNPKQYGLGDLVPDAPVLFDTVTTDYSISLQLVADLTGSTVQELVALNPAMLRLVTASDIPYDLHLPPGTKQEYLDRLKNIPEEDRTSWRFHVVQPGETMDQIATEMHGKADEIADYNDVTAAQPLEAGDELVVPLEKSHVVAEQRYTPRRHDTLITIADHFGVTVEQLRAWNHLRSNRIAPGHTLYVSQPIRLAPGVRSSRRRKESRRHLFEHHTSRRTSHESSRARKQASSHSRHAAKPSPKKNTRRKKKSTS
jgi:membrane-bound lytic murein transglycosylase D